MRLTYLGHSAFLLTSADKTRVLMDPYRPGAYDGAIKYAPITVEADIVTVSHEHEDHSGIDSLPFQPLTVRTSAQAKGIRFTAFPTWHDDQEGELRGPNRVIRATVDGLSVVHCGDLGHTLSEEHIGALAGTDILLIPVGGRFTIGPSEAAEIVEQLQPRVVIPMHYRTARCRLPIGDVSEFLEGRTRVRKVSSSTMEFETGDLPSPVETLVLEPAN